MDKNLHTTRPSPLDPKRTIPFVCLGSRCPNTCCGPFHGTGALQAFLTHGDLGKKLRGPHDPEEPDEAQSLSIFAQIRLTPKDVHRLQEAGLDHMIVRRGNPDELAHYLSLKPDGTCAALTSDKLCGIYPHRPTMCRAFPFYFDLFAGLAMVSSCPGVGAGESTIKDLEVEIRAAIEMYEYWLNNVRAALKADLDSSGQIDSALKAHEARLARVKDAFGSAL